MSPKISNTVGRSIFIAAMLMLISISAKTALGDDGVLQGNSPPGPPSDISERDCTDPAQGGDPVCLRTGEYYLNVQDLALWGRAMPVTIERRYSSKSEYNGRLGYGWDWSYNIRVRPLTDGKTVVFLTGENRELEFTRDNTENPVFDPPSEIQASLLENEDGTYTLIRKYGTELDFDDNGNLTSLVDRNNNKISFEYEPGLMPLFGPSDYMINTETGEPSGSHGLIAMSFRLKSITDDLGRDVNLYYDSNGLMTDINDFAGRNWHYTYDVNNDLAEVRGPTGLTTLYSYDYRHNLTSITDPNGDKYITLYYNAADEVNKQDYGYGSYIFSYNRDANYVKVTDREGFDANHYYNDHGNLVQKAVASYITIYERDPDTLKTTRKIFPAGNYIDYDYDANGNLLMAAVEPNIVGEPNIVTIFTYEPEFDFVKTVTDPLGNVTTYTYDYEDANIYDTVVGNLMKITYPEVNVVDDTGSLVTAQPTIDFTYNDYNQVETITAPDGIVTKFEYYTGCSAGTDPNCGRLRKITVDYNVADGCNITAEFKYDWYGNVTEVADPNGDITKFAYNAQNLLTRLTSPAPYNYEARFSYNKNKKLSQIERVRTGEPNQITGYTYDLLDNLKTITDSLNNVTEFDYDNSENLTDFIDAENNTTNYQYDQRDLLVSVTDANGGITRYGWTANGDLNDINDAKGNITRYEYDDIGRLWKTIYPDGSFEQFGYDKKSNIVSRLTRKGETITYKYDALGRLIEKGRPGEPNIIYRYDIAGRLVDAADAAGMTSYDYDRVGRVINVTDPCDRNVGYEYNDKGLRTKLTYPDDTEVIYEYDALSRVTAIKYEGQVIAEYQYDDLSRRTLLTYGNDANIVYQYDIGNRLKRLTNNISSEQIDFNYADYDKVGNRLSMKIGDANTRVYQYDKLYQLTYVDYNDGNETRYYYDKLGNRTKITENTADTFYDSNALNQYVTVGGTSYEYDKNGNLTYDGTNRYYYDCENRLTDVNDTGGTRLATYKYDSYGRRVSKTLHASQTTIYYCYDGGQIIAEYDGNGNLLRKFVYGPGIDEPICLIDVSSSETYYYHYDGLGSVVALSDENNQIIEKYSYDVYGEPNRTSSIGNPYFFTAREYDPETGLYYYRARYYSPDIGRFLQTDPIGYSEGLNLYTYCMNNPTNFVDPYGLLTFGYGRSASGGAGGGGTIGWMLVFDTKGNVGILIHGGGGGYAGAGGSITVDFGSYSGTINNLKGFCSSTGGSGGGGVLPTVGGEFNFSETMAGGTLHIGAGVGVPLELHSFLEYGKVTYIGNVFSPSSTLDYWGNGLKYAWQWIKDKFNGDNGDNNNNCKGSN